MSEPAVVYHHRQKGGRLPYELTPTEIRIIEWLRSCTENGRHWMGTIRYVKGGPVQLYNMTPAGKVNDLN